MTQHHHPALPTQDFVQPTFEIEIQKPDFLTNGFERQDAACGSGMSQAYVGVLMKMEQHWGQQAVCDGSVGLGVVLLKILAAWDPAGPPGQPPAWSLPPCYLYPVPLVPVGNSAHL